MTNLVETPSFPVSDWECKSKAALPRIWEAEPQRKAFPASGWKRGFKGILAEVDTNDTYVPYGLQLPSTQYDDS
ncbi:hypothetical protein [Nostoc sp.]|uniref:hypothetical protein n=1 Tax=Nostoc sp. TaxID=1180 RepID=UPI002FFAD382